jgi:hypothetical protein
VNTFYLTCFVLGFVLSVLSAFSGLGHLHLGHWHLHVGHGHAHGPARLHSHSHGGAHVSAVNGFTLPAFLCWFGGAGYLLRVYTGLLAPLVMLIAVISGLVGASFLYVVLFKFLLPHERVLDPEDTRMDGVVGRVSSEIREGGGTGEIIFSQADGRRSAAARSESGVRIERGTEVVVLRYIHGIAYVSPLEELIVSPSPAAQPKPQL